MFIESFRVESPNVRYGENEIETVYSYETTELVRDDGSDSHQWFVKPKTIKYRFKTDTRIPKLGYIYIYILTLFNLI